MVHENKELVEEYVDKALKNAKINVLGLEKKIRTNLINLSFLTIYSLYSLDKYGGCDKNSFTPDEIQLIEFKRDNYAKKMRDMVNIAIDPENCTVGPINMYYDILLAIEKYSCNLRSGAVVASLTKNSLSIEDFNKSLSLFKDRDVEWLKLSKCERLSFKKIGLMYGVSGSLVGEHVSKLIDKMFRLSNTFLIDNDKILNFDDEDVSKEDETSIEILGLNRFDVGINGALRRKNIKTLGDLKEFVKNYDLKKDIRGIGEKRRKLIIKVLEEYKK